jgi:hypothetical protein
MNIRSRLDKLEASEKFKPGQQARAIEYTKQWLQNLIREKEKENEHKEQIGEN